MSAIATGINVKTTKGWKMLYWMSTMVAAAAFGAIGVANLVHIPKIAESLLHLGYPAYFGMILGSWELFGSIAIIIPGLPRLKEWAYAGMFFTLTGAALSHTASGDPAGNILAPLVLLVAVMTSWMLQPARNSSSQRRAKTRPGTAWLLVQDAKEGNGVTGTLIYKS